MARMKTFFIYALCIVLFFIYSDILININLESTYRKIERKDSLEQVTITQAEATKVNGRIKGTINLNEVKQKYLKFDFYLERDVLLGTKYIDILELRQNETQNIELYFKLQNVSYYNMSLVDEKDYSTTEMNLLPKDLSKSQIYLSVFLVSIMLH